MKKVYIFEPDPQQLGKLKEDIKLIDPDSSRYRLSGNLLGGSELTISEYETFSLVPDFYYNLDLLMIPLLVGGENLELTEERIRDLKSVQLAFRARNVGGYKKPVVLTTDDCFKGTLELILGDIEQKFREDLGESPNVFYNSLFGRTFLNLYSTKFPEVTKRDHLLNYLEGSLKMEIEFEDFETEIVTMEEGIDLEID